MKTALAILLLFALTLGVYWNSLNYPFVFDDLVVVGRTPTVWRGEFNWNLLSARSILYLSFTANHIIGGNDPFSYHVVNLALHFGNGVLIFLIARRML